jgi:ABC-type nitrate/sulfonate/bicarbonate transport system substrate-binding protein
MQRYSRREALQLGAVGGVTALLGPAATAYGRGLSRAIPRQSSLTPVSFLLSWIPGIEWGGTYIAQERGYYKDEGINLTVLPGGPNVTVEPQIASNKVLIGMTYGLGTALTNKNGGKMKIFGTQYQRSPDVIVSLSKTPIRTLHDLIGKTIGVSSDASAVWQQFLGRNHIATSQVHTVPSQSSLDPLVNGQMDGILTYSTETAQLNAQGLKPVFLFMSDYKYNDISNGYGASVASLQARRDDIVKFLRGEIRGWQDFVKDPEYGAHLTVSKYAKGAGLSLKETIVEAQQTAALMTYGPVYKAKGLMWLSPALEQSVIQNVNPALHTKFSSSQLFDGSVMPLVYQGKQSVS